MRKRAACLLQHRWFEVWTFYLEIPVLGDRYLEFLVKDDVFPVKIKVVPVLIGDQRLAVPCDHLILEDTTRPQSFDRHMLLAVIAIHWRIACNIIRYLLDIAKWCADNRS